MSPILLVLAPSLRSRSGIILCIYNIFLRGYESPVPVPYTGRVGQEFHGEGGCYIYMGDLCELDSCIPLDPSPIPPALQTIATPLKRAAWAWELCLHPDQEFADFILRGLERGFRIGFDYRNHRCTSARRNMLSAVQHPQPIDNYITQERRAGRIIGPLPLSTEGVQVSRFGVIPKPHQPSK